MSPGGTQVSFLDSHSDLPLTSGALRQPVVMETVKPAQVMATSERDVIDFSALERERHAAVESERRHRRENDAKLRVVGQRVATYREFRVTLYMEETKTFTTQSLVSIAIRSAPGQQRVESETGTPHPISCVTWSLLHQPHWSGALTNPSAPPPALPLSLETVVEENSFSSPSPPPPPPPSDDDSFPPLPNDGLELPAPPPPPPPGQEVDVTLPTRRSRRRHSPPTTRSLSLRVRSGPASRCRYTRSLFLPAIQSLMIPPPPPYPPPHAPPHPSSSSSSSSSSFTLLPRSSSSPRLCLPARLEHLDLEIPAPPPPLLLDDEGGFDDIMPPLPPPVDYDTSAPPHYLEKVVALYSYEATKPDDLSLAEGDVIYLTRRHDDGWCEGSLNGNQGFFPANYVQLCD
ncbi:ABI gene family member 3-like protein [Lates japonicus]|uniref:ABI gene family member 3 n=1 Tax=Lates japonicus TaxID=270547 RepID=A0AAD3NDT6_LATJO|nr:ABI gene family member 3-like protein [Lates japonicus]